MQFFGSLGTAHLRGPSAVLFTASAPLGLSLAASCGRNVAIFLIQFVLHNIHELRKLTSKHHLDDPPSPRRRPLYKTLKSQGGPFVILAGKGVAIIRSKVHLLRSDVTSFAHRD
uniref:Secreted protein n=1 Tax=Steinernema glaseri TaxID=37863 RepID=A0A1I7YRM0_9BILA